MTLATRAYAGYGALTTGNIIAATTTVAVDSVPALWGSGAKTRFVLSTNGVTPFPGRSDPGSYEIVEATALSGSTFTITRAREGTSAAIWNTGTHLDILPSFDLGDPESGLIWLGPDKLGLSIAGVTLATFSASGIDLSATTNIFPTGTFTPTLVSSGGGTPTYSVQIGTYTRIGNRCFFQLRIVLASLNTLASGSLSISPLPLTPDATANNFAVFALTGNALGTSAVTALSAQLTAGSTAFSLTKFAAGAGSTLNQADITGTAVLNLTGQYQV